MVVSLAPCFRDDGERARHDLGAHRIGQAQVTTRVTDAEDAFGTGATDHGPSPSPQRGEPVREAVQERDVDEEPHDPARETTEMQPVHAHDRLEAADGRCAPGVAVPERDLAGIASETPADAVRGVESALKSNLTHT